MTVMAMTSCLLILRKAWEKWRACVKREDTTEPVVCRVLRICGRRYDRKRRSPASMQSQKILFMAWLLFCQDQGVHALLTETHGINPHDVVHLMQTPVHSMMSTLQEVRDFLHEAWPTARQLPCATWFHPFQGAHNYLGNRRFTLLQHDQDIMEQMTRLWITETKLELRAIPVRPWPTMSYSDRATILLTEKWNVWDVILFATASPTRQTRGTMILQPQDEPMEVKRLFRRAMPQNDCEGASLCQMKCGDMTFEYHQSAYIREGLYLKFIELAPVNETDTPSECTTVGTFSTQESEPLSPTALQDERDTPSNWLDFQIPDQVIMMQTSLKIGIGAFPSFWRQTGASAPLPYQPEIPELDLSDDENLEPVDDNFMTIYGELASATLLILLRPHEGFQTHDRYDIGEPWTMTPRALMQNILDAWPDLRTSEWTITMVSDFAVMSTAESTKVVLLNTGREDQQDPVVLLEVAWEFSRDFLQIRMMAMQWADLTSRARILSYLDAEAECQQEVNCFTFHQGAPLSIGQATPIQNGDIIQVVMLRMAPEHAAYQISPVFGHLWDSTQLRITQILIRSLGATAIYVDQVPDESPLRSHATFPTSQRVLWKQIRNFAREAWSRLTTHVIWNIYQVHRAWKKELGIEGLNEIFVVDEKYQTPVRDAITVLIHTVEIDDQGSMAFSTYARRMTEFTSREELLQEIQLEHICESPQKECLIQCNGRILERRNFPFKSGDFCSIRIQPNTATATCRARSRTPRRATLNEELDHAALLQVQMQLATSMTSSMARLTTERMSTIEDRKTKDEQESFDNDEVQNSTRLDYMDTYLKSRPGSATHARERLPPPGNGPTHKDRKVTFDAQTCCDDGMTYYDSTMNNEYLENMYHAMHLAGQERQNEYLTGFAYGLKHDDIPPLTSSMPIDKRGQDPSDFGELVQRLRTSNSARHALTMQWDAVPDLHPNVWAALLLNPTKPTLPATKVHIYTDGSAVKLDDGTPQAAWAFAVILEFSGGEYQMTGFNGQLVNEPSKKHGNEQRQNSIRAEASALLWAICWTLTWQIHELPEIEIHADNLATLFGLQGLWQLPADREDQILEIQQARFLLKYLQAQGAKVKCTHAPAHCGVPGNEAADSVCKAVAKGHITIPDHRDELIYAILAHEQLPWAWWNYKATSTHIPNIEELREQPFELPQRPITLDRTEKVEQHLETVKMIMMTYNVQSLKDKEIGFGTRRELLARQANELHIDLLALQETRYPCTIVKSDMHYIMLTSQADKHGNYGTELWIRKKWGSKKEPITMQHLCVVSASPTMMKVAINAPQLQADVYVLHAPQNHAADRSSWWQQLDQLMRQSCDAHRDILLLGDCNARVGEVMNANIGNYYAEPMCPNGRDFQILLQKYQLCALNTFEHWSSGHPWTFGKHRIDYIATPLQWQGKIAKVQTWKHFELLYEKEDHLPVMVECAWCTPVKYRIAQDFDKKEATKPENAETIEEIFDSFEAPTWQTHVDDHAQMLQEHVQERLVHYFPKKSTCGPLKPYIAETTWILTQDRKQARRTIQRLQHEHRVLQLRELFDAWKGRPKSRDFPLEEHMLNMQKAFHEKEFDDIMLKTRKAKKKDRSDYLCKQLREVDDAISQRDSRKLYQALRYFRPQNHKKRIKVAKVLPMLEMDGIKASTYDEYCAIWETHWAALECASILPKQSLNRTVAKQTTLQPLSPKELPNILDLERSIFAAKNHKCPGPDGVPMEIIKNGGAPAVEALMELMVKQAAQEQTPVHYQGGTAIPVYKRGTTDDPKSYRAIVLSNSFGKTLTKTWRRMLAEKFTLWTIPFQGGARPGVGTIAHITSMRVQSQLARQQGQAYAMILMDVESAFYRAFRGHLLTMDSTDEEVAKVFSQLGMPQEAFKDFCALMNEPSAFDQAQVPLLGQRLVASSFEASWAQVPGSDRILQTKSGTRPGDPTADLMYSFIMRRYLNHLAAKLEEFSQGDIQHQIYTWVDDIGLCIRTGNQNLQNAVTYALQQMHDTATCFAMKPNIKKGKTEVMMRYHGYGQRELKRDLDASEGILEIDTTYSGKIHIHLVDRVQYLGAYLDADGKALQDIRRTTGVAYAAIKPLARNLLRNAKLPQEKRVEIMRALSLSHTSYSAGTWAVLSLNEQQAWRTGIGRLYRLLAPVIGTDSFVADYELRMKFNLDHPDDLLSLERLRLLNMLAKHADDDYLEPFYMQDTMQHEYTWCHAIRQDFRLLRQACPTLPEVASFRDLIGFLREPDDRRAFLRSLRYWQRQLRIMRQTEGHMLRLQTKIKGMWQEAPQPQTHTYECDKCQASFPTKTALGVHRRQKHQIFTMAAHFAPGTGCLACGRGYHVRSRLVQHLQQGGTDCLRYLAAHVQPLSTWEVLALNLRDREMHRTFRRTGRKNWEQQATFTEPIETEEERLFGVWEHQLLVGLPDSTIAEYEAVKQASIKKIENGGFDAAYDHYNIADGDVPWDLFDFLDDHMARFSHPVLCRYLLEETRALLSTVDLNDHQLQALQQWEHSVYERMASDLPLDLPTREPQGPRTRTTTSCSLPEVLMTLEKDLGEKIRTIPKLARPMSTAPIRFCLLLFSGTRRFADITYHLENMQSKAGWTVIPVLLDLGISTTHGNLLSQEVQLLWLRAMREGLVCYAHFAPPCETWSVARENTQGRKNDRPRPLRSREQMMGRLDRDLRELMQAMVGNALLMTTFLFALVATILDIAWSLEHPSGRQSSASIWHLRFLQVLKEIGGCQFFDFLQGTLGAVSAKPTTFAYGGKNEIEHLIRDRAKQWIGPLPRHALVGKDSSGRWKTHRAKQYPSILCWCIAAASLIAAGRPLHPAASLREDMIRCAPTAFHQALEALWPTTWNQEIAPDYHC